MLGGDLLDDGTVEQTRAVVRVLHVELEEAERTERRVGSDAETFLLDVLDQTGLDEVRVVLDLENSRTDASVAEQVHDQLGVEVGDTDAAGELLVNQRLHSSPGLLDGSVAELDLVSLAPAGGVLDGGVDVFQRNGEVDVIEVKVVDAPVSQLLAGNRLDLVTLVEGVPQLGNDEQLLTLHDTLLDGAGNTLTSLDFVAVVCKRSSISTLIVLQGRNTSPLKPPRETPTASAIEQTVTSLDSVVNLVRASVICDLPETETDTGHVIAAVKLDSSRSRHFV